jgi:hypothetical protein
LMEHSLDRTSGCALLAEVLDRGSGESGRETCVVEGGRLVEILLAALAEVEDEERDLLAVEELHPALKSPVTGLARAKYGVQHGAGLGRRRDGLELHDELVVVVLGEGELVKSSGCPSPVASSHDTVSGLGAGV